MWRKASQKNLLADRLPTGYPSILLTTYWHLTDIIMTVVCLSDVCWMCVPYCCSVLLSKCVGNTQLASFFGSCSSQLPVFQHFQVWWSDQDNINIHTPLTSKSITCHKRDLWAMFHHFQNIYRVVCRMSEHLGHLWKDWYS